LTPVCAIPNPRVDFPRVKTRNIQDRSVAIIVVACSVILLGALAWALSGAGSIASTRTVRLYVPDFTGINPGSVVRYGGARAGVVHRVRILSMEERRTLPDPACLVEVTLALNSSLPPLPADIHATVAAETLLADKFVSLLGGSADAPPLANGAVIPATSPVTIDALVHRLNDVLLLVSPSLDAGSGNGIADTVVGLPGLIKRLHGTLDQVDGLVAQTQGVIGRGDQLITEGRGLVGSANSLVGEAGGLVSDGSILLQETRTELRPLLQDLRQTAQSLDKAARQAERTIAHLDPELRRSLADLQKALRDFQLAAAHGRIFTETIAQHPHRLIWGRRNPPPLPSEEELLSPAKPTSRP
jgi:ABC-type transporter Mla subunit MlaD